MFCACFASSSFNPSTVTVAPFNGVYDTLFVPMWKGSTIPFALIIFIGVIVYAITNSVILFTHYRQSLSDLIFGIILEFFGIVL